MIVFRAGRLPGFRKPALEFFQVGSLEHADECAGPLPSCRQHAHDRECVREWTNRGYLREEGSIDGRELRVDEGHISMASPEDQQTSSPRQEFGSAGESPCNVLLNPQTGTRRSGFRKRARTPFQIGPPTVLEVEHRSRRGMQPRSPERPRPCGQRWGELEAREHISALCCASGDCRRRERPQLGQLAEHGSRHAPGADETTMFSWLGCRGPEGPLMQ